MEKITQQIPKRAELINDLKKRYPQLSDDDFISLASHGISIETAARQLAIFREGIIKADLDRPAVINDGILFLDKKEHSFYVDVFEKNKHLYKLKKFVPASGAASRMFKFLVEFRNEFGFDFNKETINAYINRKEAQELKVFFAGMEKFPFYGEVIALLKRQNAKYDDLEPDMKHHLFVNAMLAQNAFDFCNKPKGILPFHKYSSHTAVPVEEHLHEGASYAASNNQSHIHFTVSEPHRPLFEKAIELVKAGIEANTNNTIHINFSYQDQSTDSISVDENNNPVHVEGQLAFRPGGHGALINNLDKLDADIIFIKNIDNVIQNHIEEISLYKKSLAGQLLYLKKQVFSYLEILENASADDTLIAEIVSFAQKKLNINTVEDFDKYTSANKISWLRDKLNRPIRVCGMVKNEGEPGGGPFWVRNKKGNVALQIVEGTQVDHDNKHQVSILKNATHFNPVDLVCFIRNYKGEKFDLHQFTDPDSGFIVEKNKKGKLVRSYELPGLWNGAMARWITVFVEVPLITFNPVKTVNDLLKPAHQPQ